MGCGYLLTDRFHLVTLVKVSPFLLPQLTRNGRGLVVSTELIASCIANSACPVCYLPVLQAMELMPAVGASSSPVLKNLTYVVESPITDPVLGVHGLNFGGHASLEQRDKSFQVQESMQIHCGFVKGSKPGVRTGFDIDEEDLIDMGKCQVVVASAIFGNYDQMQQPKNISQEAMNSVCFFIFIDEETEQFLKKERPSGNIKKIGLWRVVVAHNLPYSDARRNGKIPKLLLHRLFPNAQFSLWIDGKLELVVDPYQILERFLWRSNSTFAISQHYKRFNVFEEAEANKAAGKYDNVSIDVQVDFYRNEGLKPFDRSKSPVISDVPEGCVIIREHTTITNLFTCLWFNEVDRFTSRDQLSFAIVRKKIMEAVPWKVNMFLDCERRNFVVQGYHRDVLEHRKALLGLPMGNVDFISKSRSNVTSQQIPKLIGNSVPEKVDSITVRQPGNNGFKKVSGRRSRERHGTSGRQRFGTVKSLVRGGHI
eukprot:c24783_g1_i2 orf=397-1842(-)